jgi:hypothetical protein
MDSTRKQARVAGLLYVLIAATAPVGLIYVPGKLFVTGDATATADHLRASESLLRMGIARRAPCREVPVMTGMAARASWRRCLPRDSSAASRLPWLRVNGRILQRLSRSLRAGSTRSQESSQSDF